MGIPDKGNHVKYKMHFHATLCVAICSISLIRMERRKNKQTAKCGDSMKKGGFSMIIDFHTHTFPDELAKKALPKMAEISGLTPVLDGTMGAIQKSMAEHGIDISVLMPVATKPAHVPTMNNLAMENNRLPGFRSFGAMHLDYTDKPAEYRRIADGGLKGIKLHFDYMRRYIDSPESVETINQAFDAGLAVLVHAGLDPVSPDIAFSSVERIAAMLPKLTKGKLILAHFGGLRQLEAAHRLLVGKDVYLDCSTAYYYADLEDCRKNLADHDPDKLLYGSDSPWFSQSEPLSVLRQMELSEELIEKICWTNGAKILGLKN